MKEESILQEFKDDFVLFIEAGFIAVKQFDEIAARRLFKAAELLNPDNPASQLGLGYIELNKLKIAEATKIFESIVAKDPEHYLAQSMLAVCYIMTKGKRKKGEELLELVKQKSPDQSIKNLTDVCMGWAHKDLQEKELSPLIPKKEVKE
jgi:tetratricopeptide (TPR) repeat protein